MNAPFGFITLTLMILCRSCLYIYELKLHDYLSGFLNYQNNLKYKYRGLIWRLDISLNYLILQNHTYLLTSKTTSKKNLYKDTPGFSPSD